MAQPYPMDTHSKQQQSPQPQDGSFEALRRRTWDEQGLEEKVELLRQQLRSKDFALREIREQLNVLMQHQHGPNGELLAPLFRLGAQLTGSSYDPLA